MKNRITFVKDGFLYEAEVPFKPQNGDYLFNVQGKKLVDREDFSKGTTREEGRPVVIRLRNLAFNATLQEWQPRPDIVEWHQAKNREYQHSIENQQRESDPLEGF